MLTGRCHRPPQGPLPLADLPQPADAAPADSQQAEQAQQAQQAVPFCVAQLWLPDAAGRAHLVSKGQWPVLVPPAPLHPHPAVVIAPGSSVLPTLAPLVAPGGVHVFGFEIV